MESRAHAIIAISFLIVFSICAFIIYLWLNRGIPEDRFYDIVSDHSVSGLQPETGVTFKGLRVGSVRSIEFDPRDPAKVIIHIAVSRNAYITHATYAQLSYQGITGLTYISLHLSDTQPRTPLATHNNKPARIPMKLGLIQYLTESSKTDMAHLNNALTSIAKVINEKNADNISQMLTRLNEASAQLLALEKTLSPSLKQLPKLASESDKLLQEGQRLIQHVNQLAISAQKPVNTINGAADSVKAFGNSARHLTSQLSEDIIPRIQALTTRMEHMVNDIDRLSKALKESPQSLLYGNQPPSPGPGEPGFQPGGR
jgi:phospholipid/cholesterol/gamma-HCH transport system substrate-binding protein